MQIAAWQQEYNESRPHRALGEVSPAEFARQHWLKRESGIEKELTTNSAVGYKNPSRS
jgi:hypothetical protein